MKSLGMEWVDLRPSRRYYPGNVSVNSTGVGGEARPAPGPSNPRGILRPVRRAWLLVILGPSIALMAATFVAVLFLPHPIPKTATPAQRLYLANCASCHGANGRGSWRATLFLMRPGNLADPRTLAPLSDDYLLSLIKNGGAALGTPGMPAFGFHLSDGEIRQLIAYIRGLPRR